LKKLLPYILFEKYIYILPFEINDQPREPALCQLYRHTFVPHMFSARDCLSSHGIKTAIFKIIVIIIIIIIIDRRRYLPYI